MDVVARDGDSLLIADGPAGAVLLPDGAVHVGQLAVLAGHGQWVDSDEPLPSYAPADLQARLAAKRAELEPAPPVMDPAAIRARLDDGALRLRNILGTPSLQP
jgi:hypothetical protein